MPAATEPSATRTVLVNGGCHGAWCWDGVIAGLAEAGVAASAFDLPCCGADRSPRAGVTLDTCVACVVEHVDELSPGPVRLVAHSIDGWLLPPVGAPRPRVVELVFVGAAVLHRGERGIDVTPVERRAGYYELAAASGDDSLLLPFEPAWARFLHHLPEDRARAMYARAHTAAVRPLPGPGCADRRRRGRRRPSPLPGMTDDRTLPLDVAAVFAAKAGVAPEVIPGDHDVMLSDPVGLARALGATARPVHGLQG